MVRRGQYPNFKWVFQTKKRLDACVHSDIYIWFDPFQRGQTCSGFTHIHRAYCMKNQQQLERGTRKKNCSPHVIYYKRKLHYEFRNHWNEFSTRNCWRSTTRLAVGFLCVKFCFENSNDKWATATIERITNYSNYSNCYYCEANDIFQMVIANGVHTLFEWSWWWTEW